MITMKTKYALKALACMAKAAPKEPVLIAEIAATEGIRCREESTCGVRLVLQDLYETSVRILESTTMADLVQRAEVASQEGPPILRYFI